MDLDAFYCAVEEQFTPSLRGKAFAVGGSPGSRGVVASCSYPARIYGVRSAMPMARALQLCPDLIIIPWRRNEYSKKSKQIMGILKDFSPILEQLSIDEAFLDMSEHNDPALTIGKTLQTQINDDTGLPCSLGIATNKLVAKIATDVGKASKKSNSYPNAIQLVDPGQEANFLAPLPAQMLWGIGPKMYQTLEQLGLYTIGDIANWPEQDFINRFGIHGQDLAKRAKGIDISPVTTSRETKSISKEVTFKEDISNKEKLLSVLQKQSESIEKTLQKEHLQGTTIRVKFRWPNFETITRQTTLPEPTDQASVIFETAKTLFAKNWKPGFPVRLIGVEISGFHIPEKQLSLWEVQKYQKNGEVDQAITEIKQRYGENTIQRGPSISDD